MSTDAPVEGTRKRLDHIDAMRPVKQAAVVSTHTLIFFAPLATNTTVIGLIMLTGFRAKRSSSCRPACSRSAIATPKN
jgi:hypothetical protein